MVAENEYSQLDPYSFWNTQPMKVPEVIRLLKPISSHRPDSYENILYLTNNTIKLIFNLQTFMGILRDVSYMASKQIQLSK